MEKTIFIVNSQSDDNRLCSIIARTLFNANILYVHENDINNYSNQSIFDSGLIETVFLIDVLPDVNWIETNLETYPNLKINILSKNVDNNTYYNLANVVKVIERNSCQTLSLPFFQFLKMEYWLPDGETMMTVLFKLESMLFNYEKYCATYKTDSIRINNHYNYLLVCNIVDKYWKLNLSHETLILLFKSINTGVNNLSGTILQLIEQEVLTILGDSTPIQVKLNENTTITVTKFNLKPEDYKQMCLHFRNIFKTHENTFNLFYEINQTDSKVICRIIPSDKLIAPIPLIGQDAIDYLTIENIAKINLFVTQTYNVATELMLDGSIQFEVSCENFF